MTVMAGGNVRDASPGEYGDSLKRSVVAVAYWAAWVALGMWGFRFLVVYRRNAFWMVLAVFLFTRGDIIGHAQLDTVVERSCESACVLMFLAGMHRTVVPPGKLGFHRFVALNPLAAGGDIVSCGEYARCGVSKDFCSKVDTFVPPAMCYPTRDELVAAHVISAPTPVAR